MVQLDKFIIKISYTDALFLQRLINQISISSNKFYEIYNTEIPEVFEIKNCVIQIKGA